MAIQEHKSGSERVGSALGERKAQLQEKSKQVTDLSKKLKDMTSELEALKTTVSGKDQELGTLKQQRDMALSEKAAEYRNILSEKDAEIQWLDTQADQVKTEYSAEIEHLHEVAADVEKEHEAAMLAKDAELQRWKRSAKEHVSAIAAKDKEIADQKNLVASAEGKLNEKVAEFEEHQTACETAAEDVKTLKGLVARSLETRGRYEAVIAKLQSKLAKPVKMPKHPPPRRSKRKTAATQKGTVKKSKQ